MSDIVLDNITVGDWINRPLSELEGEQKEFKSRMLTMLVGRVLGDENKLLIFQEDIMKLFSVGAGFTMGEADDIRRAMGKKKKEVMEEYHEKFVKGWEERGHHFAEDIWLMMIEYTKYGFNKSHAVAYTVVTLKNAEVYKKKECDFLESVFESSKKKEDAVQLLSENYKAKPRFCTLTNPNYGISFSDETNLMALDYDKPLTVGEFFFCDIPNKLDLLRRGILDTYCQDILGLATLFTKVKFNDILVPDVEKLTFLDCFETLKVLGKIDYIATNQNIMWVALTSRTHGFKSDMSNANEILLGNPCTFPTNINVARSTNIKKQIKIYKNSTLDWYPESEIDRYRNSIENLNTIIERFKNHNPNAVIDRNVVDRIRKKTPKSEALIENCIKKFDNEFRAIVLDSSIIKSSGNMRIDLLFGDSYKPRPVYLKKPVNVNKGQEVLVTFEPDSYLGRDKTMKSFFRYGVR